MTCRGIRGATTVQIDSAGSILAATRELLRSMAEANKALPQDISSAIFTMTPDLRAAFPARAARELGWEQVALLDAQEIPVEGALPRCIRILLHWNTDKTQAEVRHIYLHRATALRPDVARR